MFASAAATPHRPRETNLSRVLNLLHRSGSLSRAEIARETGLSASTVSALVSRLLANGFAHESGPGESSGGRPPILVQFNYDARYLIGVDIGATHLTIVLMDMGGRVTAHAQRVYAVAADPSGTTTMVLKLITEILEEGQQTLTTVLGMGVAVPAPLAGEGLDRLSGIILPAWAGYDLRSALQATLPLPIYVDNDANAGAIAERWWGHGKESANLAYIKLGTGVGGGLIIAGEIHRGDGGTAGEIGHTPIDPEGPRCRCGKQGCLESYLGAPALVREVARLRRARGADALAAQPVTTVSSLVAAARAGDFVCQQVIVQAGGYLGLALANLLNLLNPGLIVLGGDLTGAGAPFLEAVQRNIVRQAMPKAAQEARILFSELGNDVIAIGAATLALQQAFHPMALALTLPD
ncbi:MAG: ROK family transcriptional regulator [Candidatus Promineifilaceae bacterium]|nr:ROK family transcriptional regulator [Candidatus Promineifilaceae bacterium]